MLLALKKHLFSTLALILIVWTASVFVVDMIHFNDPVISGTQSFTSNVYGFPSYNNWLYRPLVALDAQFQNPDHDPDGPAVIAFLIFPALSFLLSGVEVFRYRKNRQKHPFPTWVFGASIATPLLLLLIQYIAAAFNL